MDLQREMLEDRQRAQAGELTFDGANGGQYNLDIDIPGNAVTAVVEDNVTAMAEGFESRYGSDAEAISVERGDIGGPECSRIDCRYTLRSGLQTYNAPYSCSTAFTVTGPQGHRQVLTAGHCPGGTNRWHGGQKYGDVVASVNLGQADAQRHSLDNGWGAAPWVYKNDQNKQFAITSQGSYSTIYVGKDVCKSGYTTGRSCGTVTSKDFAPSWIPNAYPSYIKTTYCADEGDSGAGVYDDGQRAHGIHSGGSTLGCGSSNDWSAFTHIDLALYWLQASLVLSP